MSVAPDTFWTVAYPEILAAQELLRGNKAALYRLCERLSERINEQGTLTDEERVVAAALKLAHALVSCMENEHKDEHDPEDR